MTKIKNLVYLAVFSLELIFLKLYVIDKAFVNLGRDSELWFTSGLLLIILGVFVTEKYFTKSLDVIVNIVTLGVVLSTLDNPSRFRLWNPLLFFGVGVGLLALTSFILYDEAKDPNSTSQKLAHAFGTIARFLGSSKMLFSIVFLLSIFNYFIYSSVQNQLITSQQTAILSQIIFWGVVLLVEPIDRKLIQPLIETLNNKNKKSLFGKVIKRMSPNVVVIESIPNSPILKVGDMVLLDDSHHSCKADQLPALVYAYFEETDTGRLYFFYSVDQGSDKISTQIYAYLPSDDDKEIIKEKIKNAEIYKNRESMIGFVATGSNIDLLKIRLIEGIDEKKCLKEGDLISVSFYGSATKYQIINVETSSESVDAQSKQGIKIITAQQIGYWEEENKKFADTGWVPEVNAPVYIERENATSIRDPRNNSYKIGVIPKSNYPIYLNFKEAVSHHIAIIGKTGTGKSFMAARIIEKLSKDNYKIVILEIDQGNKQSLSKYIDSSLISSEATQWTSEQKQKTISGRVQGYTEWKAVTNYSPADNKKIFVINWENQSRSQDDGPVSQTDGAIAVITNIIKYQTQNPTEKICIVMEEAYDFIPESTFGQQDFGQPSVSRASQLVLKCRKHNIGFLIITQRTALVTKTILYQCHTIIALQSFDETSKTFMSAYINQKYLESMSILPRYRAIVVGKGSSCDKPVIVDFFDKSLATN